MKPRKSVITLAVSNLDRALRFYRDGLGLDSAGVIGTEFTGDKTNPSGAVAMFRLQEGLILALYPRTELAKDAKIPFGPPKPTSLATIKTWSSISMNAAECKSALYLDANVLERAGSRGCDGMRTSARIWFPSSRCPSR